MQRSHNNETHREKKKRGMTWRGKLGQKPDVLNFTTSCAHKKIYIFSVHTVWAVHACVCVCECKRNSTFPHQLSAERALHIISP